MFDLSRELVVWMKTGLGVFLLACIYLLSIATLVAAAAFVILRGFLKYRRAQHVICPRTNTSVDIRVAPVRAAIAALFGEREFHILSCSTGKALNDCDHSCLSQLP
jgi:hypothetical protein